MLVFENTTFFRNKDDITKERLASAKIFVLASPREKFKVSEVCLENNVSILFFNSK